MDAELAGNVVVVTGATAGIGRATTRALTDAGATVVAAARDAERLAVVAAETGAEPVPCDVRDPAQRAELVHGAVARHGRIDGLVNNAAVSRMRPFLEHSAEDLENIYQTNTVAYADLTRLAVEAMMRQGSGHVVEVSSVAAWAAAPPLTVYSSSKHAVAGLVQALRAELRGSGVLVHSVNPWLVSTEFFARADGPTPAEGDDEARRHVPGSLEPEQVAAAVVECLSSTRARTITVPRLAALTRLSRVPVLAGTVERLVGAAAPLLFGAAARVKRDRAVG